MAGKQDTYYVVADTYMDLFLGYSVLWLFLFVFLIQLISSQRKLRKSIEELEQK
jgi:CcmD family protein